MIFLPAGSITTLLKCLALNDAKLDYLSEVPLRTALPLRIDAPADKAITLMGVFSKCSMQISPRRS